MDRNISIDALRAVGALSVFLFHLPSVFGIEFGFGWVGVNLFFVVSGYLITGRLLDLADRGVPFGTALRSFYARRVLRIVPVYVVFLAIVTVASLALSYQRVIEQLPYAWTYTFNFFHASAAFKESRTLGPTWSLAVEEQFYLLFPLVVLTLGRRRLASVALSMILAGPVVRLGFATIIDQHPGYFADKPLALYVAGFTHIDAFAFGAILNLLPASILKSAGRGRTIVIAGLTIMLLGLVATGTSKGMLYWSWLTEAGGQFIWGYTALNVVAALLVCRAVSRPTNGFFGLTAPLARIGQWSYGFYLVHDPIQLVCLTLLASIGFSLPDWVDAAICLAVALGIARLLYEWVEKPALRLKGSL